MRKRVALLLILCSLSNTGATAQPVAQMLETDSLSTVLEQQPLVKCLSVFSDISLQVVNKWFLRHQARTQSSSAPKPAKRTSPLSRDMISFSSETGAGLKVLRCIGTASDAVLVFRLPVLDGISVISRSARWRPDGCILFALLLLLTILPRADLGDGALVFSCAFFRPIPQKRDRVFSLSIHSDERSPSPRPSPIEGEGVQRTGEEERLDCMIHKVKFLTGGLSWASH